MDLWVDEIGQPFLITLGVQKPHLGVQPPRDRPFGFDVDGTIHIGKGFGNIENIQHGSYSAAVAVFFGAAVAPFCRSVQLSCSMNSAQRV